HYLYRCSLCSLCDCASRRGLAAYPVFLRNKAAIRSTDWTVRSSQQLCDVRRHGVHRSHHTVVCEGCRCGRPTTRYSPGYIERLAIHVRPRCALFSRRTVDVFNARRCRIARRLLRNHVRTDICRHCCEPESAAEDAKTTHFRRGRCRGVVAVSV